MPEIEFNKYKTKGTGYHWTQNTLNPFKMNAYVKARYQNCISILQQELGQLRNHKVLDFGCGDGVLTWEIEKAGAQGYGVDSSEIAIQFARKKHRLLGTKAIFHCESCYETSFESNHFDAIISTDVIEHVQDPVRFLKEIHRVLKKDGIAIMTTPIRITESPLDKMHVAEWFPSEFQNLLGKVFPSPVMQYSHPVFWMEFITRSNLHRYLVNCYSLLRNPFRELGGWRFASLQYGLCRK